MEDSAIRRQIITNLKAQVELCRITCAALERELNQPGLLPDGRIELFQQLDAAMRDRKAALKKLVALEQVRTVGC